MESFLPSFLVVTSERIPFLFVCAQDGFRYLFIFEYMRENSVPEIDAYGVERMQIAFALSERLRVIPQDLS